jgi:hypothetical protein
MAWKRSGVRIPLAPPVSHLVNAHFPQRLGSPMIEQATLGATGGHGLPRRRSSPRGRLRHAWPIAMWCQVSPTDQPAQIQGSRSSRRRGCPLRRRLGSGPAAVLCGRSSLWSVGWHAQPGARCPRSPRRNSTAGHEAVSEFPRRPRDLVEAGIGDSDDTAKASTDVGGVELSTCRRQ